MGKFGEGAEKERCEGNGELDKIINHIVTLSSTFFLLLSLAGLESEVGTRRKVVRAHVRACSHLPTYVFSALHVHG